MPTGYQIKDRSKAYYLTFQVVYWIDLFTRKEIRDIIIDSLKHCQNHKGLEIYAYVIMSNHIHLYACSNIDDLSGTIRDFKKYTSKKIIDFIEQNNESRKEWLLRLFAHAAKRQNKAEMYQIWTHENHAEVIYSNEFITQKVDYIHNNPVRAALVDNAIDYRYSSARNYADMEGLIEVIKGSRIWKTII